MHYEFSPQEQTLRALSGPQFDRDRHGSLYDRGSADSYYGRGRDPHWYPMGTHNGVCLRDLTSQEIAEYNAGYDSNQRSGAKKQWF